MTTIAEAPAKGTTQTLSPCQADAMREVLRHPRLARVIERGSGYAKLNLLQIGALAKRGYVEPIGGRIGRRKMVIGAIVTDLGQRRLVEHDWSLAWGEYTDRLIKGV